MPRTVRHMLVPGTPEFEEILERLDATIGALERKAHFLRRRRGQLYNMAPVLDTLGRRLRRARFKQGNSLRRQAERTGLHGNTLDNYEADRTRLPDTLDRLRRLAEGYGGKFYFWLPTDGTPEPILRLPELRGPGAPAAPTPQTETSPARSTAPGKRPRP